MSMSYAELERECRRLSKLVEHGCLSPNRRDRTRIILETWLKWWDGPARDFGLYDLPIIPPVTATREILKACVLCAGIEEDGVCELCGRIMQAPAPGA